MKPVLLLALTAWTCSTHAQGIGGSLLFSTDSDANDIQRQTLFVRQATADGLEIGASAAHTAFRQARRHSSRFALQHEFSGEAWSSRSDFGVETLGARHHLTGELGLDYRRGQWTWSLGAERSLVDSREGIERGLNARTLHAIADWSAAARGATLVLSRTAYSDRNDRPAARVRLWHNLCADCGVHALVAAERYTNTRPYTGNYFSPERYLRVMAGAGLRQRFDGGTFAARALFGRQRVDGVERPSSQLQLGFDSPPAPGGWRWQAALVRDQKQPGYAYLQGTISAYLRF